MNSKENTDYLVEQLTELRDLIILIERGGNDTPDVLYKLAIEKSNHITSYIQQWREEAAPCEVQVPAEYAEWVAEKTVEEAVLDEKMEQAALADEALEKSAINMPIDITMPGIQIEAPEEDIPLQPADVDDTTDSVPAVEMPFPLVEDEADDTAVGEFPEDAPLGEVSLATDEEEHTDEEMHTGEETEPSDEVSPEGDDETDTDEGEPAEEEDEQQVYNMGEPFDDDVSADTNMTVGEMMSVRRAKELRRAISLNDRFRFRRELFGNSDVRMTETLALIDAMTDCGEARDYLLNDLGWDIEEPVVKEFLALVEKHFKQ